MTHRSILTILLAVLLAYLLTVCFGSLRRAGAQNLIDGSQIAQNTIAPSQLASTSGTPNSTTYYRGDGTWQAVTGGYTLPIASSTMLGGVKIGSGIVEAGDGTISVTAGSSGGFVPGSATAPSLSLYPGYYLGTSEYVAAHASWISNAGGAAVPLEGGGALYYQTSTTGSSYTGPDGTGSTYYVAKGSDWIVSPGITSGSIYVKAFDVNASGSLSTGVTASTSYAAPPGVGTVTSVGLSLPGIFTVTGSPVNTNGTLSASLATQSANAVFAGPSSGSAAVPTFRALMAADIPSLTHTQISDFAATVYGLLSATSPLTYNSSTGAISLLTTGTAGTYGDSTHYAIPTVDAYGRVTGFTLQSVSSGGGFTPASVSAPSTVTGAISDYSSTTAYVTYQDNFSGDVSGEAGGDTRWQYSADNATWKGPDGTSGTYYYVKGSHWRNPNGFGTGSNYARASNVNASGSVSGAVASAAVAYVSPVTPGQVQIFNALPTASSSYRGVLVQINGQPVATGGTPYANAVNAITSLKNWWRLQETSGTSIADSKGTRTGTYSTGASLNQSACNQDAGEHSVKAGSGANGLGSVASGSTDFINASGITLLMWFNSNGSTTGSSITWGFENGQAIEFQITLTSSPPTVDGRLYKSANYITAASSFSASAWHLFAVTLTTTTLTLYVDGTAAGTASTSGNMFTETGDPLLLPALTQTGALAAEISTFNAPLTSTQISTLWSAGGGTPVDDKLYDGYELANGTYGWKQIF